MAKITNLDLMIQIKRILLIRTDRLGEFILTLPAIEAVREKFPKSHIALMLKPYNREIVENNPGINEFIEYEDAAFEGFLGTLRLIKEIKKRNFDLAIIFNPKRKFNIASFFAGISLRVGYDRKWGFLLNKKIKDLKYSGAKHEVEYNFDLIRLVGIIQQKKVSPASLFLGAQALNFAFPQGNSTNFVAVHPWASNSLKEWPRVSFLTLIRRLIDELNLHVVIIGGEETQIQAENFKEELKREVINLAGKTSLKELAAVLKNMRVLVTNDSGPMHLAAMVNTPVVALFRKSPPGVSAKRWGPLGKDNIVIENDSLDKISPDEVFDGVKKTLQR